MALLHPRSPEPSAALEDRLWHTIPALETARELHVDPATGLTSADASSRLAVAGPNRLENARPDPGGVALLAQYRDPFQVALSVVAVIALALGAVAVALVAAALTLVVGRLTRRD
jgi:Ca2+-transporting ATPase